MKDINEVQRLAEYYGIRGMKEGESDVKYREHVASKLRQKGLVIEAHEVISGLRWNEPGGLTGVMGAVAKAFDVVICDGDEFGTDIAAGEFVRHSREKRDVLSDALDALGIDGLASLLF